MKRAILLTGFVVIASCGPAWAQQITSLTAGGYPLEQTGGSGGQELGEGDLSITIGCSGYAIGNHYDDWVFLEMRLYVANQLVDSGFFVGNGWVSGNVGASVRASTGDRQVVCEAAGPGGSGSDSGTLLGSGPLNANLVMDAFLPYEWIRDPWDPGDPFADPQASEGDNRGFGFGGTSRATSAVDLLNPAVSNTLVLGDALHLTGLSIEYDAETSLSDYPNMGTLAPQGGYLLQQARDDWQPLGDKKLRWGNAGTQSMYCNSPERLGPDSYEGTSTMRIYCEGAAYYPFHSFAPGIDWQYTITLTFGRNSIWWAIEGCRDSFPAFEVHLNGQKLIHHGDDGSPTSLFPTCDATINESGVIR